MVLSEKFDKFSVFRWNYSSEFHLIKKGKRRL